MLISASVNFRNFLVFNYIEQTKAVEILALIPLYVEKTTFHIFLSHDLFYFIFNVQMRPHLFQARNHCSYKHKADVRNPLH